MRRKAYACLLAAAILVFFLGNPALGQQTETLADVLAHNSIATDAAPIARLHSPVTSYEVLNDSQEFVIGYYLAHEDNQLDFPLFLSRLDKRTGEWRHAELKDIKVSDPDETDGGSFNTDCLGSVTKITHKADRYYLDLHWNPSAECQLILHEDFTVDNTLPGWELAELKGVILWEHNMVHFSSTHPLQLWLYDLAGGRSQRIYPQANDPLRENFKRRLAAVIDQGKCQKNDWACDPDQFSSDVETVEADEQSGAFALQMVFSTEGFLTRDEAEKSGAWTKDEYVYIYRLGPFAWRALPIDDLRPKFGTDSLKELLTPEKLPAVLVQPR